MSSVLDLLITEISNVLGISPDEVKTRFTKEELEVLLNNSLCEPEPETTLILPNISELPCDELEIPDLLPPEATDLLDELDQQSKNIVDNSKKCIDKVSEVNEIIEKQIDEFNKHKILLEKLIEYRDNYFAVGIYFEERSKEASKFLGEFRPILEQIKNLENAKIDYRKKSDAVSEEIRILTSTSYDSQAYQLLLDKRADFERKIEEADVSLTEQRNLLNSKEEEFPLFDNWYVNKVIDLLENSSQDYVEIRTYLRQLLSNYISYSDISAIDDIFKKYSELIECFSRANTISSVQELIEQSYFSFKLEFLKLNSLTLDKEITNKQTGERSQVSINFPIKGNPLLEKDSFFRNSPIFFLSEYQKPLDILPGGRIYTQYYNLFNDPINNFFSPSDRGLSEDATLVDPSLKGTGAETKRENAKTFYIQDLAKLQNFYNTFEDRFEKKKEEVRSRVIEPSQNLIRSAIISIARKEVQLALALNGVNRKLPEDSGTLKSTIDSINRQNLEFATGIRELNEEISRISNKLEELRPDPTKIKKKLKELSPECFEKIDDEVKDCGDTKQKLGTDPLFIKTIRGTDPTLPDKNQLCYWKEFSKIVNTIGLLPIPNLKAPPQLRYWPIGLVIPYPAGIIKIPLPIVWIPLIVISTPIGNIVIFLTINGVFISPVVFFVSSNGFKQHIITIRGSSEKFGFSSQDEVFKPGLLLPLGIIAAKEKAARVANEAVNGKYSQFSEAEKQKILQASKKLEQSKNVATESGNAVRLLKLSKEIANFEQLVSGESPLEILSKTLDKSDSPIDAIEKVKNALNQRLTEIGKPEMRAVNKLKEKIINRRNEILSNLQKSLEKGDLAEAGQLREQSKLDGVSLNDKISAITDDMKDFYNKIKFPRIIIPRDPSTIDPKQNAINEAIVSIFDYINTYSTQFFSREDLRINKLLTVQLLKIKPKIKEKSNAIPKKDGKIDIDQNINEVKSFLKETTSEIIDFVTGRGEIKDPAQVSAQIADLSKQLENETNTVKRKKLQQRIDFANQDLSDSFEKTLNRNFIGSTASIIDAQSKLKIEFDPFAPCCAKKVPEFQIDSFSPAIIALDAAKETLDAYISSLDSIKIKKFTGGRSQISADDLISGYREIIRNQIPSNLVIPSPALSPVLLLKSMSGFLLSQFEPKAPNIAAQPQLPSTIVIDLNILKAPLLDLLITFLLNCLPSTDSESQAANSSGVDSVSAQNKVVDSTPGRNQPSDSKTNISDDIIITDCEPSNSEDSILSNGYFSPEQVEKNKKLKSGENISPILSFNPSGVIVKSNRDILPSFQTLNTDLLSINSSDLTAILKNFIDIQLDVISNLISPFYTVFSTVKGTKGVNLNIIEDLQYKTPPYGPAAFSLFSIYTKLKQNLPGSLNHSIFDVDAAESALEKLEPVLSPLGKVAPIIVSSAGAADSVFPPTRVPSFDTQSGKIINKNLKASTSALRLLHPILNQDDLPPWERLSSENLLFVIFVDEFISVGADQVGFFRSFV